MTILSQAPSSVLILDGGINFRSLGGLPAAKGRLIKENRLFRAGALYQLSDTDCHKLSTIPLNTILDYRDIHEVEAKPDKLWQGVDYQHVPANPLSGEVNGNLEKLTSELLADIDGQAFMTELYRRLPFDNSAYRQLALQLRALPEGAIVQHCAFGKDRTGVGSALVLFALGADEETVMADYLLTEKILTPYREQMLSHYSTLLSPKALAQFSRMLEANSHFLISAIDAIKHRYGTIDLWLEQEYQLDHYQCERIRDHYLTP